ncbi:MAG: hypothetical protein HKN07_14175 [Acidimicrobiia bacterium]|nr:hypothetical protein [Acidimicrobiia bacterium]
MSDKSNNMTRSLGVVAGAGLIVAGIAVGTSGLGVFLGIPMALSGTTMLTASIV